MKEFLWLYGESTNACTECNIGMQPIENTQYILRPEMCAYCFEKLYGTSQYV